MATPRLPFLWPLLFRPVKSARPSPHIASRGTRPRRAFVSSPRSAQGSHTKRYGTAQEPAAHLREQDDVKNNETVDNVEPPSEDAIKEPIEEEEDAESSSTESNVSRPRVTAAAESTPPTPPPNPPRTPDSSHLDTVLHMPSPAEEEQRKSPHLKAPPYVHHFDTYSLVKQLNKGNFTPMQAVSIMKAVRSILNDNMDLAREGLVSKSNVENEAYLFRAACSELRTEVGNNRTGEAEKSRSERNQLQHEVEILGQRMGQETSHLKDELKGLFDDRKMAVRQEQRSMESKIQELNYKITVALNSDARSEVEALRWVLTRRAAMTIGIAAFMLFIALRYSSHVTHVQQEQKKKESGKKPPDGGPEVSPTAQPSLNGQEVVGGELLAASGVSLG